jgi:hypothetical protein
MAVRELTRAASRGYVETPSEFGEKVGGAPFHRWFVRLENCTLVFTEKTRHPFDDLVAGTLYRLTLARDRSYNSFYHSRFDLFVNCLEWEADLPVIVHRSEKPYVMPAGDSPPEKADFQHFGLVKRLLRATMGGRAHIPPWTEVLQSTCCKASVRATQDGFECMKCGRQFRNTNGIPSFIE